MFDLNWLCIFRVLKSVNKLLFCQKLKKVGKFSFFFVYFLNIFEMIQNLETCLSQFFLSFKLFTCIFPDLTSSQIQKIQMQLFFGSEEARTWKKGMFSFLLIWNNDFCIITFKGRILYVRNSDQKIIEDQIMSIWATAFMANAIACTENKDLSRCIQMERNNERIGESPIK